MSETVKRRPAPSRRDAILGAAKDAFLRHGYEASLETIADAAGVARRTIFYNFGSKEELFREIIEAMSREAEPLLALDTTRDLESTLLAYARTYVSLVVSPETVAIQRLLLSGAPNLLEQMRSVVTRNYARIVADLAAHFRERIAAGEMRDLHCERAAERFVTSVLGFARIEMMLGLDPDMSGRDAYITEAVAGFLDGVKPRQERQGGTKNAAPRPERLPVRRRARKADA